MHVVQIKLGGIKAMKAFLKFGPIKYILDSILSSTDLMIPQRPSIFCGLFRSSPVIADELLMSTCDLISRIMVRALLL